MRIYIAQLNPTVGDLAANAAMIRRAYTAGAAAGADIVVVPELAVTGYPPRDLLEKASFVEASLRARDELAGVTGATALIFGCITRNKSATGKALHNAAVVARSGSVVHEVAKRLLPTYDIFDELRYFEPGNGTGVFDLLGRRVGISICEDLWFEQPVRGRRLYAIDPLDSVLTRECDLLLNLSASPFNVGKRHLRHEVFGSVARRRRIPIVYVNQVGGNDELVFDGSSVVFDRKGETVFCGRSFVEDEALVVADGDPCAALARVAQEEEIAAALALGLRDYVRKCGFRDVVLGLSLTAMTRVSVRRSAACRASSRAVTARGQAAARGSESLKAAFRGLRLAAARSKPAHARPSSSASRRSTSRPSSSRTTARTSGSSSSPLECEPNPRSTPAS